MGSNPTITTEQVVAKLKDDGHFDRLRLQVIRKLKDNEELRANIVSIVKQSSLLNQPGVENMKPRQLSDSIYEEVGDEVKSKISDGVWQIIRSSDGMKTQITDTVESVYRMLLNPNGKEECGMSSPKQAISPHSEVENNLPITVLSNEVDELMHENEPIEPPGFSFTGCLNNNNHLEQHNGKQFPDGIAPKAFLEETISPEIVMRQHDSDVVVLPENGAVLEGKQACDISDDDPDLPPGFV